MRPQQGQPMKNTLRTIIISNVLIISLLTFSACSQLTGESPDSSQIPNTALSEDIPASEESSQAPSAGDKNKNVLLPEEIDSCIKKLSENGLEIKDYAYEYDIDFDGNDELLCPFMGLLKIYKKSDNVISEKTANGDGLHHCMDGLKTLQTFDDGNEKYSCFYYDYDGGVMKCNVLTAIKYDSESDIYTVENLLSWGRLDYEGDASQFSRPFFRKGWSSSDVAIGESEADISREEFLEIYGKYQNLPPWDEFLDKE